MHLLHTRRPVSRQLVNVAQLNGCKRSFRGTANHLTDGVFRALTDARVETPWIEALRKKQKEGEDPPMGSGEPQVLSNRKLEPKKMSDSHHSVVGPPA